MGSNQKSKEDPMLGRLHSDICNVIPYLLPGVKLQIKLAEAKRAFYLMNSKSDSTNKFQFHEANLIFNRIRPNPAYLIAHTTSERQSCQIQSDDSPTQNFLLYRRTEIPVH